MSVEFRFHSRKAVEAAALLLKLHGKPMKYLGLLKMLYIADRITLERMDQPITGDNFVSMKYGPVLSGVYDLQPFSIKCATEKLSKRLKVETTMLEPVKSIFISNGINRISNSFVKSLDCTSFSRTNNFF